MKIKHCLSSKKLWECGTQQGFRQKDSGELLLQETEKQGVFVSGCYDSGTKDGEWNRLLLSVSAGAVFAAYVYLFNGEDEKQKISDMSIMEKYEYLKRHAQCTSQYRDSLLYGNRMQKGRYAQLCVEMFQPMGKAEAVLEGFALSFPREDFTRYLPAIYRNNELISRYMAVLQSVYLELEQKIDRIAWELDYAYCKKENLIRLAGLMGYGDIAETADEEMLRKLLEKGVFLSCRKGTKPYFETLACILSGKAAVLVEEKEKKRCRLLIKGEPGKDREACLEKLKSRAPLGVELTIEVLRRTDRLNDSFFLDHTAALSGKEWELLEQGTWLEDLTML